MEHTFEINEMIIKMKNDLINNGIHSIKCGHNGPYYDQETEIRYYAHWCVIFSEYYKYFQEESYKRLVRLLADAILNSPLMSENYVYKCRDTKDKDVMNGVIGPAWIIEGFMHAANVLQDDIYYERAVCVFKAQHFNQKMGLWNRIDQQGNILSVDATFNHQLWFAAAGSMINQYKVDNDIQKEIDIFIKKISKNIKIRKNGRIGHFTRSDKRGAMDGLILFAKNTLSTVSEMLHRPSLAYKEEGYHLFNLYGFAILKENYGKEIPFFQTKSFKKAIEHVLSKEYIKNLDNISIKQDITSVSTQLKVPFNVFAYAYNSPAFELPRVCKVFGILSDGNWEAIETQLLDKQFNYTYNSESGLFDKNTDDEKVLYARVYEYIVGNEEYWDKIVRI